MIRSSLHVVLLLLVLMPGRVFAYSSGVEYSSGTIDVKAKEVQAEEINKSGKMSMVRLFAHGNYSRLDLSGGLGLELTDVVGTDYAKGIRQYYRLKCPTIDLAAHFRIWYGLGLGYLLRNQIGRGASYGFEDTNKFVFVRASGPSLIYRWQLGSWTATFGGVYTKNEPSDKRTVTTKAFSFGLSYQMSDGFKRPASFDLDK